MQDDKRSRSPEPGLLRSKLARPRPGRGVVERTQLLARLDQALGQRLALISAGPGFGKTTLAAQWLERLTCRSAWLSLDPEDNDPERFSRYLVAALRELLPEGFDRAQALLDARDLVPLPVFADVLLSDLEALAEPAVLVIDDCHLITSESTHGLLQTLVERPSGALHLVVQTRVDPPWPLARWRVRGWLTMLRSRDLRFTRDEAEALFAGDERLGRAPQTVETLWKKTEGWIAGLRLAEMSLAGSERPLERLEQFSGSDRLIADYFVQEVLATTPEAVREVLEVAAVLERFCAPLCDHLLAALGRTSEPASQILERLERENLFLVPLDEKRHWYRFHHLFRELLLDHLAGLASPERRQQVERAAGAWFAEQGEVDEALRHWVAAGELDAAAELVGEHLGAVLGEELSRRTIPRWLALFPPGAEHERLPLLVAHGYMKMLRSDLAGLAELQLQAEQLAEREPRRWHVDLAAQGAWLAYWQGDVGRAIRLAEEALDQRPEVSGAAWATAKVYAAAGHAVQGRQAAAQRTLDEALAEAGPNSPRACDLLGAQAFLCFKAQDLDAARSRAAQLVAARERQPIPEFWLGHAFYLFGAIAYERNQLEQAADWFRRLEGFRHLVPSRLFQDGLIGQALLALARGDMAGVETHVAAARAYATQAGDPLSLRVIGSFEIRLAVIRGRLPLTELAAPPADDHQSSWLEVPTVTWAERLAHDPSPEVRATALGFVEAALETVKGHHNQRQATILSIVRAVALDRNGRREDALESLAETLRRAEPHGLVRAFLDRGPRLRQLLDELSKRGGHDAYLESLRGAFLLEGQTSAASAGAATTEPWAVLTHRELDVLELIAKRLTNKEIAARLAVSPEAIKKRASSIFRKLGVSERREAVAVAQARGILPKRP